LARGAQVAALHLHAALEELIFRIHHQEEFRATEADLGGDRLGGAVSARQVANPLPKDPATPALRDKRLPITRLKFELQNPGDAFVVFQVADTNASPEVEKLRPETQSEFGEGLDRR